MIVKLESKTREKLTKNINIVLGYDFFVPEQIDDKCKVDNVLIRVTPVGCGKNRPIILSFSVMKPLNKNFVIEFKAQTDLNDKFNENKDFYGWAVSVYHQSEWGTLYEVLSLKFNLKGDITKEKIEELTSLVEECLEKLNSIFPFDN